MTVEPSCCSLWGMPNVPRLDSGNQDALFCQHLLELCILAFSMPCFESDLGLGAAKERAGSRLWLWFHGRLTSELKWS